MRSTAIDLVLTDLQMTVEDGFKFIENTRKTNPGIPICVMSGNCAPQVRERLLAMGVQRHFQKPFQLDALVDAINEELKLKKENA